MGLKLICMISSWRGRRGAFHSGGWFWLSQPRCTKSSVLISPLNLNVFEWQLKLPKRPFYLNFVANEMWASHKTCWHNLPDMFDWSDHVLLLSCTKWISCSLLMCTMGPAIAGIMAQPTAFWGHMLAIVLLVSWRRHLLLWHKLAMKESNLSMQWKRWRIILFSCVNPNVCFLQLIAQRFLSVLCRATVMQRMIQLWTQSISC